MMMIPTSPHSKDLAQSVSEIFDDLCNLTCDDRLHKEEGGGMATLAEAPLRGKRKKEYERRRAETRELLSDVIADLRMHSISTLVPFITDLVRTTVTKVIDHFAGWVVQIQAIEKAQTQLRKWITMLMSEEHIVPTDALIGSARKSRAALSRQKPRTYRYDGMHKWNVVTTDRDWASAANLWIKDHTDIDAKKLQERSEESDASCILSTINGTPSGGVVERRTSDRNTILVEELVADPTKTESLRGIFYHRYAAESHSTKNAMQTVVIVPGDDIHIRKQLSQYGYLQRSYLPERTAPCGTPSIVYTDGEDDADATSW